MFAPRSAACIVATCVLLSCAVLLYFPVEAQGDGHITFIFRYDDYSSRSPTALEERLIRAFKENGVPLTIGVIPNVVEGDWNDPAATATAPLPDEKAAILRRAVGQGSVEVAMHGYTHGKLATAPDGESSEFMGVDIGTQCERIKLGKEFLERTTGAIVVSFVPPHNRYDDNTLSCLEKAGFSAVTADLTGSATETTPVRFFPFVSGKFYHLSQAIAAAESNLSDNPVVVVMMHPKDFVEDGPADETRITIADLEGILKSLRSRKDVRMSTLSLAAAQRPDFSGERLREYRALTDSLLYRLSPGFLRRIYWPERYYPSRALMLQTLGSAPFYLAVFLFLIAGFGSATFFSRVFVMRRAPRVLRWIVDSVLFGTLLVGIVVTARQWNGNAVFWGVLSSALGGFILSWVFFEGYKYFSSRRTIGSEGAVV